MAIEYDKPDIVEKLGSPEVSVDQELVSFPDSMFGIIDSGEFLESGYHRSNGSAQGLSKSAIIPAISKIATSALRNYIFEDPAALDRLLNSGSLEIQIDENLSAVFEKKSGAIHLSSAEVSMDGIRYEFDNKNDTQLEDINLSRPQDISDVVNTHGLNFSTSFLGPDWSIDISLPKYYLNTEIGLDLDDVIDHGFSDEGRISFNMVLGSKSQERVPLNFRPLAGYLVGKLDEMESSELQNPNTDVPDTGQSDEIAQEGFWDGLVEELFAMGKEELIKFIESGRRGNGEMAGNWEG